MISLRSNRHCPFGDREANTAPAEGHDNNYREVLNFHLGKDMQSQNTPTLEEADD